MKSNFVSTLLIQIYFIEFLKNLEVAGACRKKQPPKTFSHHFKNVPYPIHDHGADEDEGGAGRLRTFRWKWK